MADNDDYGVELLPDDKANITPTDKNKTTSSKLQGSAEK